MIEHYKQCFKHQTNHEGICPQCERELGMDGFKTMAEVMAGGNPELNETTKWAIEAIRDKQPSLTFTVDELDRIINALKSIRDSIAISSKPMSKELRDALLSAQATQK